MSRHHAPVVCPAFFRDAWHWNQIFERASTGLYLGLLVGLTIGLLVGFLAVTHRRGAATGR